MRQIEVLHVVSCLLQHAVSLGLDRVLLADHAGGPAARPHTGGHRHRGPFADREVVMLAVQDNARAVALCHLDDCTLACLLARLHTTILPSAAVS